MQSILHAVGGMFIGALIIGAIEITKFFVAALPDGTIPGILETLTKKVACVLAFLTFGLILLMDVPLSTFLLTLLALAGIMGLWQWERRVPGLPQELFKVPLGVALIFLDSFIGWGWRGVVTAILMVVVTLIGLFFWMVATLPTEKPNKDNRIFA